jgi:hypothetical protein
MPVPGNVNKRARFFDGIQPFDDGLNKKTLFFFAVCAHLFVSLWSKETIKTGKQNEKRIDANGMEPVGFGLPDVC